MFRWINWVDILSVTGKSLPLNIGFDGTDFSLKSIAMAFYGGLYTYDGW